MEEDKKIHWTNRPRTWTTSKGDVVTETGLVRSKIIRNCLDFQALCELFLETCRDEEIPMTMARLLLSINMTQEEFDEAANKTYKKSIEDQWAFNKYRSELLVRMRTEIEANRLEGALSGKQSATIAAFELKNKHKWVEKTEQAQTFDIDVKSLWKLVQEAKERDGEVIEENTDGDE